MSLSPSKRRFYQANPLLWARDRLGIRPETVDWPTSDPEVYRKSGRIDDQGNIVPDAWDGTPNPFMVVLDALANRWREGVRGVAVESGNATGKTWIAGWIPLWFLDVFGDPEKPNEDCVVITLAPKADQLKDNLWKEVDKFWPMFHKLHPQAEFFQGSLEIRMGRKNWNMKGRGVAVGEGEEVATKAAGYHGKHMLYILEETPGINPAVIKAMRNTSTAPHNIFLALGNPDSIYDPLHELAMTEGILHVRISAYDHPNIVMKNPDFVEGAVSEISIQDKLSYYKEVTNPMFLSRVRGICPDTVSQCLFRPNAIRAASDYLKEPIESIDLSTDVSEGFLNIYFPRQNTHINRYIIFADPAGDQGNLDRHAAIAFDRLRERSVATMAMRGPRIEFITALLMLCDLYKVPWTEMSSPGDLYYFYPLLNWEKNNVGALVLDERIRKYPSLYHSRNINVPEANTSAALGWNTNKSTRKTMMDELEHWGLELFEKPFNVVCPELFEEMKTFVWVPRGNDKSKGKFEAAPGSHDDMVLALSGCLVTNKVIGPVVQQQPLNSVQLSMEEQMEVHRKSYRARSRRSRTSFDNQMDIWSRATIPENF